MSCKFQPTYAEHRRYLYTYFNVQYTKITETIKPTDSEEVTEGM